VALNNLDHRRLRDYFSRIRQQEAPSNEDEVAWRTLLVNTEIMVEQGVTVGGILLFGITPNRFLPQAGIDAAAFPALRKTGSKLIDSSTFFQNGSDRSVSPHEIQRLFNEAVFYKRAVLPQ